MAIAAASLIFSSIRMQIDGIWMLSEKFCLQIPIKTRFERIFPMVIPHCFHEFVYQYDPWIQCCHVLIHIKTAFVAIPVHVYCLHIYDELLGCIQRTISYLSIDH